MSFRKRNIGLASPPPNQHHPGNSTPLAPRIPSSPSPRARAPIPGVRPSPLDGRPTTSTGTQTLDDLLAGHAGLALGNSVLVEENGTTDFAGALLRYYAAEGVLQGHVVHVVGAAEQWGRELPGAVSQSFASGGIDGEDGSAADRGKMKIAWRYERLGDFGAGASGARGGESLSTVLRVFIFGYIYVSKFPAIALSNADSSSLTDIKSQYASAFSWSARGLSNPVHFLSFIRPDKTAPNLIIKSHQHPPHPNSRPPNLAIPLDYSALEPKTLLFPVKHNPPANHAQPPFPTILPPTRQQPATHPPIPPLPPCTPPSPSHTANSHAHALTNALPALHRPRALDGNPLRRCVRISALPARHGDWAIGDHLRRSHGPGGQPAGHGQDTLSACFSRKGRRGRRGGRRGRLGLFA